MDTLDPLHLTLAMARDWTAERVVRDAPERVPLVIQQLIAWCEKIDAERVALRTAGLLAHHEMRHTPAPRNSFTDALDALDKALHPDAWAKPPQEKKR